MKILLTGSNGYIGREIKHKLSQTCSLVCASRNEVDLTSYSQVDKFFSLHEGFDVVIHAANKGGSRLERDDSSSLDQNIQMYNNLLRNSHRFEKFIFLGSGAEIYRSNSFYGLSKKAISKSLEDKNKFYNLRIFGIFNHAEPETRFIKSNLLRYINKTPMKIHENRLMDFVYMEDFLEVLNYYLTENPEPFSIDCCYQPLKSFRSIAEEINKLDSHTVEIIENFDKEVDDYISQGDRKLPVATKGLNYGLIKTYEKLCQIKS
tara:strand:+ start:4875 stop:5660 length:786 start_codon:yes stop_codon:yes gene_type:complete